MKKILVTIVILAALGVGVSSYALWQHYAPLGSAFCSLGETFSCDLVNKSAFSEVLGIPVAGIGIVGYVALFALALGAFFDPASAPRLFPWILAAAIGGLLFSLYLTYVELFVIGAICILCVTSQALILAISVLAAIALRHRRAINPTWTVTA